MVILVFSLFNPVQASPNTDLWQIYETFLKSAKYIDLTHSFSPTIPVWPGFAPAIFNSASAGADIPEYIKEGEKREKNIITGLMVSLPQPINYPQISIELSWTLLLIGMSMEQPSAICLLLMQYVLWL